MLTAVPALHFDTDYLPPEARLDAVRTGIGAAFDLRPNGTAPGEFCTRADIRLVGQTLINSRYSSAVVVERTRQRARRDGLDHYVFVVSHGISWIGEIDGVPLVAPPGSVVVIDLARATLGGTTAGSSTSYTVSRDALDSRMQAGTVRHGTILRGAMAGLLTDYFVSLERRLPSVTAEEVPFVERATHDFMAACTAPSVARFELAADQIGASLRIAARRAIDARLHQPDLSPAEIAVVLGVSRAALYRACEPDGGVAAMIWQRRLKRAAQSLTDPADKRRVSQIAFACGFASEAHFSRAFRREFGATPTDIRMWQAAPRPSLPPAGEEASQLLRRWTRHLAA